MSQALWQKVKFTWQNWRVNQNKTSKTYRLELPGGLVLSQILMYNLCWKGSGFYVIQGFSPTGKPGRPEEQNLYNSKNDLSTKSLWSRSHLENIAFSNTGYRQWGTQLKVEKKKNHTNTMVYHQSRIGHLFVQQIPGLFNSQDADRSYQSQTLCC